MPIAAAWQHRAAQALTFEAPAGNDADATVDPGSVPDIDRRLHVEQKNEQRADAQLSHLLRQNFGKGMCVGHRRSPVWTRTGRCRCGRKTSQSLPGRRSAFVARSASPAARILSCTKRATVLHNHVAVDCPFSVTYRCVKTTSTLPGKCFQERARGPYKNTPAELGALVQGTPAVRALPSSAASGLPMLVAGPTIRTSNSRRPPESRSPYQPAKARRRPCRNQSPRMAWQSPTRSRGSAPL